MKKLTSFRSALILLIFLSLFHQTIFAASSNPLTVTGRTYFYDNEPIDMVIPSRKDKETVVLSSQTGVTRSIQVPAMGGQLHFRIQPLALSPGSWTVKAGDTSGTIVIASNVRGTPYTFYNYQSWIDDEVPMYGEWLKAKWPSEKQVELFRTYGINVMQLQNGGIPLTPRTQDLAIQAGTKFTSLNNVAGQHQPGGAANDWSVPEVIIGTRRGVQHSAQVLRRAPGFLGVHYADEPGLTYGIRNPDGTYSPYHQGAPIPDQNTHYFGPLAVPTQHDLYKKKTGKPLPDLFNPQANLEAWLDFMRFRTTILGDVFGQYTADIHQIDPNLIGYSQLYAWMFLSDGEYPAENTKGVDVISTHAYIDHMLGLWYPIHESDAMRDGSWDKPLWMMPSFAGMIRMPTVYGAMSRKLEGLGWDRTTMPDVPETKKLAERMVPISGMLHDVTKPRDAVAIFYSRDQYLVEITKDLKNTYAGRDYAARLVVAWIMSNATQRPASRIVEEDLLAGRASKHKVIIAPQLTYARPEIKAALEKFIAGGGLLLMDQSATLEIKGATKLPFTFVDWWAAVFPGGPTFNYQTIFEKEIVAHLPAFNQAIGNHAPPLVKADSPWLLTSEQLAQKGRYIWLVNMRHTTTQEMLPLQTSVTLPEAPAIYDVFQRKLLDSSTLSLDMPAGDAAIYALMPAKIQSVQVTAKTAPSKVTISVEVLGEKAPVDAVIPLELELLSPDGSLIKKFQRATKSGKFTETIDLGNAPMPGAYKIKVTELLGNLHAESAFEPLSSVKDFATVAPVDVYDISHLQRTIKENSGKTMLVLYGDEKDKPVAQQVAKLLESRKIKTKIDAASNHVKVREGWNPHVYYTACIYSEPLEISGPAVLVGDKENNPLIKRLVDVHVTPLPVSERYPGKGRAMVYWARSILGLNKDLVILYGGETAPLERAVKALGESLKTGKAPVSVLNASK
ncbi:hypothetical protein QQ056_08175 [Oscillatoria laete-virens NRMC-F 0139]|nr:hypothetical protein [Oscillatoria laete-virens NRMC-F 0139]